eukprot:1232304-Amphidinium_carterae.1
MGTQIGTKVGTKEACMLRSGVVEIPKDTLKPRVRLRSTAQVGPRLVRLIARDISCITKEAAWHRRARRLGMDDLTCIWPPACLVYIPWRIKH